MFSTYSNTRSWITRFLTLLVLAISMTLSAAPPAWWSLPDANNHTIIDPTIIDANPKGPANIGQAKYIAKRALDILNTVDPSLATQVRDKLSRNQPKPSSPGELQPAIVDFELPGLPLPDDWHARQHAPLLIGQLKALATPFYDVLHLTVPLWLDNESSDPSLLGQLQLNATKDHADPSNYYPWSSDPSSCHNQAVATIGQLKAVFSLRLDTLNAILDSDHDGLTNAEEALHHTDPFNPDTDGDGMPDAWEIKWGLDPLNPADAIADTDGDSLSNLAEYKAGTTPTGIYCVEVMPIGVNTFFHSAADDGSVLMQASLVWDSTSTLELFSAQDADGFRTVTPMPPVIWNSLDTIVADLIASGFLNVGDSLTPCDLASSDGTYRVFQSATGMRILHQPGYHVTKLPDGITWQVINNNGQAAAITERLVAAAGDVPEHLESDLRIAYGFYNYSCAVSLPAVWFPAAVTPTIEAFSDSGDVLVRRALTHSDGSEADETYLLKVYESNFTLVRQPALPGQSIIAISPRNLRMLGSGPKPFQITPDGTPILLEAIQIATTPSAQPIALSTLYPNPLVPHHITSDGRITLTTTNANHQTTLLQIIPNNDSDHDGLKDDWEKSFAQGLLASGKSPEDWGYLYDDLLAGNLNPVTDYTGDGITTALVADLFSNPPAQQSPDSISIHSQYRRNILAWGVHSPAFQYTPERFDGLYFFGNDGYFGPCFEVTCLAELQPEYLATTTILNSWEDCTGYFSRSQFLIREYPGDSPYTPNLAISDRKSGILPVMEDSASSPSAHETTGLKPAVHDMLDAYPLPKMSVPHDPPHSDYFGDDFQSRIQLVASKPSPVDRSIEYIKLTTRRPYSDGWNGPSDVVEVESKSPVIPAEKITSEWIELIPPVVDTSEYEISLMPVQLAVDANHDGKITFDGADATSEDKPFVFWVNDDHDVKDYIDMDIISKTLSQFDAFEGIKDCQKDVITCTRDLEDFTRLHLSVAFLAEQIKNGTITVGLEFVQTTDNPSIIIFMANEADGGMQYLLKNTVAEAQIAETKYNTTLGGAGKSYNFKFPARTWDTLSSPNSTTHLIFEGATEGKGKLQFTLYKGEQKLASCGNLWIELKSIKKMYQRWNANEVDKPGVQWSVWPSTAASQDADSTEPPTPQTDDEKDFVLFVHGWNMNKLEKRAFAETAYKRLWQLGYKGRFGAFFWPTFYDYAIDPRNFDGSEQRAWNSSDALLELLTTLNMTYPGRVNLLAHSMGNVVASEALHKASSVLVKNYVASQAALPADVFKLNPDITDKWLTIFSETTAGYVISLPSPKKCTTPNVYAYYYDKGRTDILYRKQQYPKKGNPYMAGIGGAAKWHNYLNPNDWALGLWVIDQAQKPNGEIPFLERYDYVQIWLDNTWVFKKITAGLLSGYNNLFLPENRYEIFCYCAQAHSNPTGRQNNVGGPFVAQKNFSAYGDKHPGHSAQFLESISDRWHYWNYILTDFGIRHIQDLEPKINQ